MTTEDNRKSKVYIEFNGTSDDHKFLTHHLSDIVCRVDGKDVIRGVTSCHELRICIRYLKENKIPYKILYINILR